MKKVRIILCIFIIGCGQRSEITIYNHVQKTEIKKAIIEMLNQSTDPFLIVEDYKTQKFIQFYNESGRILIDLPEIALTSAEIKKAEVYFRKYNIPLMDVEARDPNTRKIFLSKSWTDTFAPEHIDKAVNIAIGALFEIYGIDNSTQLILKKGWE